MVLDRDIFGEPGWDILLCACIACRKGVDCVLDDVAAALDLSPTIARRWVDLLVERSMLVCSGSLFALTDVTKQKLATMFKLQVDRIIKATSVFFEMHPPRECLDKSLVHLLVIA